jgi:hypothetical protein
MSGSHSRGGLRPVALVACLPGREVDVGAGFAEPVAHAQLLNAMGGLAGEALGGLAAVARSFGCKVVVVADLADPVTRPHTTWHAAGGYRPPHRAVLLHQGSSPRALADATPITALARRVVVIAAGGAHPVARAHLAPDRRRVVVVVGGGDGGGGVRRWRRHRCATRWLV